MVFVTVKLNNGQYEKFAENTYYKLCGNEPGALFQIDMGNRKLTLSTSTGLDDLLGPNGTPSWTVYIPWPLGNSIMPVPVSASGK